MTDVINKFGMAAEQLQTQPLQPRGNSSAYRKGMATVNLLAGLRASGLIFGKSDVNNEK